MSELPTGTVTFLFTDIEGSTARWEQHPEEMRVALVRHDKILESAIDGQGGVVFSRMGDGMAAAFASPRNALGAAVSAQEALAQERWPQPVGQLTVRMGVHTGEGTLVEGQYLSQPLNRCARLMAIAHGGQVLASGTTESLISGTVPDGVGLLDLGEHRLRDLSEPLRVFQVERQGRRDRFPPLRSLDSLPGNLPLQVSSFVGRERELDRVAKALAEGRIVTLTGVGGVGKTRLALQAAADVLPAFREGAWLVELAPVRDPDEVAAAVAGVFNLTPRAGATLKEILVDFLRTKQVLLVIDNCEHLLEAVADLIDTLERACGGLVVLATSREGLGLEGEQNLTVPSLATPDPAASLEQIEASDAVSLFVQRAKRADADFVLDAATAPAVVQVCRRLDGVPLAMELAAAQIAAMTPAELAAGLDRRFETLAGGRRRAVQRHQTLRATIDWSYDLLTESEAHLLDRLSVFSGGCSREGAEGVCAGAPIVERELFGLLRGLVAKSLVVAERADQATRYRLLETIREYGEERLAQRGEALPLRDRHAGYYADFIAFVSDEIYGPKEIQANRALVAEKDNGTAAMNHAIDTGQVDLALRLLGTAAGAQASVGYPWRAVESILALPGAAQHPRYPFALAIGASMAALRRDFDTVTARRQEAAAALEHLGGADRLAAEHELNTAQTVSALARGEVDLAAIQMERNVELELAGNRPGGAARLLAVASALHADAGDVDKAIALATEGLALARQEGGPTAIISNLTTLAELLADRDPERAQALWRESVELWRSPGYDNPAWRYPARAVSTAALLEDWPAVLELGFRTIRLLPPEWRQYGSTEILDVVARALTPSNIEVAAILQGAARPLDDVPETDATESTPVGLMTRTEVHRAAALRRETTEILIEALGQPRLRELRAQGQALDDDQVVAFALDAIARARADSSD